MILTIFGFGSIGKYYLKIVNKNKFKSIYIVDRTFKKLKKIQNISYLNEVNFKKLKINSTFAIICTPSNLHFKHANFFIKNNTHVLIEKPFVLKYEDAISLSNISKKNELRCWTVFQNRFNEPVILLKKLLKKKSLGEIKFVICNLLWNREKKYYSDGWHGKYSTDGGVLTNQAIHLLDILIYVFGKFKFFDGNLQFDKKKLEAEDYISLNFTNVDNLPINFLATTRANKDYEMSIDIFGSKQRIKIGGIALNKLDFFDSSLNKKYKKYSFSTKYGYGNKHKKLIENFFNLKKADKFDLSVEKNLYLIKLINSIYYYLIKKSNYKVNKTKSVLGYEKK